MPKSRSKKVIDITPALKNKVMLDFMKKRRAEIVETMRAEDEKAQKARDRELKRRLKKMVDLGAERAGEKLNVLVGFVDGFGKWLDEEEIRRLDEAIEKLENGKSLYRSKFIKSVEKDAGF